MDRQNEVFKLEIGKMDEKLTKQDKRIATLEYKLDTIEQQNKSNQAVILDSKWTKMKR